MLEVISDRPETIQVFARLMNRSTWANDCLVWNGYRNAKEYGRARYRGRSEYVHRLGWILNFGMPPAAKPWVLHRCDNPPCWNIEHLWVGDHQDNMDDMVRKGRGGSGHGQETHCPEGHRYGLGNLYADPSRQGAHRRCATCARKRQREYRANR